MRIILHYLALSTGTFFSQQHSTGAIHILLRHYLVYCWHLTLAPGGEHCGFGGLLSPYIQAAIQESPAEDEFKSRIKFCCFFNQDDEGHQSVFAVTPLLPTTR